MGYATIAFECDENVATITLNRPEAMNSLTWELVEEIGAALANCENDPDVRVLIITGNGRAFCAGVDLKVVASKSGEEAVRFLYRMADGMHERVIMPMRRMGKPVITAINGVAAGGGLGLALSGDIIIAAAEARFTVAYSNVAVCPDCGTSFFLPRLVGSIKAMELYLFNDLLTAVEAKNLGMINRVVAGTELMVTAQELAKRLAQGPTLAYAQTKRLLNRSFASDLPSQLQQEALGVGICAASDDHREGVEAFCAKRAPHFVGR